MNPFDEIRNAVAVFRETRSAVRSQAKSMISLLAEDPDALRFANHNDLVTLKKALARYNIHTGKWRAAR